MAVAFRASAVGGTNPTTSTTITIPAGTTADDIVLVAVTNRGATADPSVTDDEGSGSYALVRHQDGNTNGAGSLWWKRATASTAGKTITVSGCTDSMATVCYVLSGCVTSGLPYRDILSAALASGAESLGSNCGVTPHPGGGSRAVGCIFNTGNDNAVTLQTFGGSAVASAVEHLSTGGSDCGCSVSSIAAPSGPLSGYGIFNWAQTNGQMAAICADFIAVADDTDTIAVIAVGGSRAAATATTFSAEIPAHVVANDIVILCVVNRDATTDPTVSDNEGAGSWAKLTNQNATTNGAGTVWWKRASGNTAGKLISGSGLTGSTSVAFAVFRGCKTSDPPYETGASEANASGNETQIGYTPSVNGTRICFAVFNTSNDTLAVTSMACTDPGALVKQTRGLSTGGNDCSVDFASAYQATAAATGSFTWAQTNGTTASIAFGLLPAGPTAYTLAAGAGSYVQTGTVVTLKTARLVAAGAGSYAMSGQTVTLVLGKKIAAGAGAYDMTGATASLLAARNAAAGAGAYSLTGTAAAALLGRKLAAAAAAYALTGSTVDLLRAAELAAAAGSYDLTGEDAAALIGHYLAGVAGSYAMDGADADLIRIGAAVLAAEPGVYAHDGSDAAFTRGLLLTADGGSYVLTGAAAAALLARVLAGDPAGYALDGSDAELRFEIASNTLIISETDSFAVSRPRGAHQAATAREAQSPADGRSANSPASARPESSPSDARRSGRPARSRLN